MQPGESACRQSIFSARKPYETCIGSSPPSWLAWRSWQGVLAVRRCARRQPQRANPASPSWTSTTPPCNTNSAAIFGTNVDVGKGIADLLVTDLVKDGTFSIIERKALDKVMAEQNFSNSNRADPTSAAKLGNCWAWTPFCGQHHRVWQRDQEARIWAAAAATGTASDWAVSAIPTPRPTWALPAR